MTRVFEKGILVYAILSFLLMLVFLIAALPKAALMTAFIEFSFFAAIGMYFNVADPIYEIPLGTK